MAELLNVITPTISSDLELKKSTINLLAAADFVSPTVLLLSPPAKGSSIEHLDQEQDQSVHPYLFLK